MYVARAESACVSDGYWIGSCALCRVYMSETTCLKIRSRGGGVSNAIGEKIRWKILNRVFGVVYCVKIYCKISRRIYLVNITRD